MQALPNRIAVDNAGLVLFNQYIPMLFERMGWLSEQKFSNEATQRNAANVLQYLSTGFTQATGLHMPLNNVLCGLPVEAVVMEEITLDFIQEQLIQGMITGMIAHWTAIGSLSIEGFRESWLIRNGMLSETKDRWELVVERKAYDVLVNRSPFAFSIIKYPWMDKPLHVNWI